MSNDEVVVYWTGRCRGEQDAAAGVDTNVDSRPPHDRARYAAGIRDEIDDGCVDPGLDLPIDERAIKRPLAQPA